MSENATYRVIFWDSGNYRTFEDAQSEGAIYEGEECNGRSNFIDAMLNVRAALKCIGHTGLMVRLIINGKACGDLESPFYE